MGKKIKKKKNIEGIFRANEKGFGFVEIEEQEEDFFIPAKSVNGALNGDIVRVSVIKKKEGTKKAEAKVIKIVKRERESLVEIFQENKQNGTQSSDYLKAPPFPSIVADSRWHHRSGSST